MFQTMQKTTPKTMQQTLSALALLVFLGDVSAARAEPTPPPAPELKKTVDAFTGKWVYDATVTMPGSQPAKTQLKVDCRKAALGKAVTCVLTGNIPGEGPFEGTAVIGYDTFSKSVHYMGIMSDEEVHDHKCAWKGDALTCEPLHAGLGGGPVTEDLSFTFNGKQATFSSLCTFPDGSKASFVGTGKRL
jgi:hypothetical protein